MQMQTEEGRADVPLALVGSGLGGDCAPKAANFKYAIHAHPHAMVLSDLPGLHITSMCC